MITSVGLPGKKEELAIPMEVKMLNIFGISVTRGKICRRRDIHYDYRYTCLSSGDVGGNRGMAFITAAEISHHQVEKCMPINKRMAGMILKIGTSRILFMTVYAPQQGRHDEEQDRFYEQLQEDIYRQNYKIIVMGNLNGQVRQITEGYEQVVGYHGIWQIIEQGDMFLNFCNSNSMTIMNKPQVHIVWL